MKPKCPECGSDNLDGLMTAYHELTTDGRLLTYVPMYCRDCGKTFAPCKMEIDRMAYEKEGRHKVVARVK